MRGVRVKAAGASGSSPERCNEKHEILAPPHGRPGRFLRRAAGERRTKFSHRPTDRKVASNNPEIQRVIRVGAVDREEDREIKRADQIPERAHQVSPNRDKSGKKRPFVKKNPPKSLTLY